MVGILYLDVGGRFFCEYRVYSGLAHSDNKAFHHESASFTVAGQ